VATLAGLRCADRLKTRIIFSWNGMDTPSPDLREPSPAMVYASYLLAAAALGVILGLHMLSALLAGLLVYELVNSMAPLFGRRISSARARVIVVAALGVIVVGLLILLILGAISSSATKSAIPSCCGSSS
jgi:hypothetical protein